MDDTRQTINPYAYQHTPTIPERYKKFNPNPQPEYPVQNITPFPQYEEWKSQIESGTLPPEFDMRPGEEMPTEIPGEMPTGMPTGEGIETGIPQEFQQLMDFLGLTDPNELVDVIGEATDKDLATLFRLAGVKEEEEVEEITPLPIGEETREDYIKRLLGLGVTHAEAKGMANLLYPEEEELKVGDTGYTIADFVNWAVENNKTYKDVFDAVVKAGLEPVNAGDQIDAYLNITRIELPLK